MADVRTTQFVIEVVVRPHQTFTPIIPPPPFVFIGEQLYSLTGVGLPMTLETGYLGDPNMLTQLQQVRAHYTETLAPRTSEIQAFSVNQVGAADRHGQPGVLNPRNGWFSFRQTARYHRVCLLCQDEAEVAAVTWMFREAGVR